MVFQPLTVMDLKLLLIFLFPLLCSSQELQGVRLVGSTYGNHTGRVEVLYNNTWGAVCGDGWGFTDTTAVCRQLNFPEAVCYIVYSQSNPVFGVFPENGPVWITDVSCSGSAQSLNECSYSGFDVLSCSRGPAQVYCQAPIIDAPTNLIQADAYSSAVRVEWTIPTVPTDTQYIRHRVFVSTAHHDRLLFAFYTRQRRYSPTVDPRFDIIIYNLDGSTEYSVQIRTDIRHLCTTSNYLEGELSPPLSVQTANERRVSAIPIRLVPPAPVVDFMGRVEVLYNNTWGTVCDDGFGSVEADVMCQTLNFSEALCYVRESGLGRGEGPIWMDNVDCPRGVDVLDECDFNGWGVHNCGHDADIGLICLQDDHLRQVEELKVDRVGANSITVSWIAFPYPPLSIELRYRIEYTTGSSTTSETVPGTETTAILTHTDIDSTYTIRVRAEYRYSYCTQYAYGAYSESVQAITTESAPTAPPSAFHVVVINSTAVEFQWELPLLEHRNGIVQGYKLFIVPLNQNEEEIVIASNQTTEYIVNGLTPNTVYTCSILAYTVGDGPRSVLLRVTTPDENFVPLITEFGLNGDGLDRATVWPDQTDIRIHCRSGVSSNTVMWITSDGSPVGTADRNLRQVSNADGTVILQIASSRQVTYCDAGVYTCVVNDGQGRSEERDFTLLFTDVPPRPTSPYPLRVTSSAVTLAWNESACDGGHRITGYTIRYRKTFQEYLTTTNMYVYNVNPLMKEYTITGLETFTAYNFSVQALSPEFLPSEFSLESIITTATEAPSPPRYVNARVVAPYTVEVQWTEPAEPNGIVTAYTVYVSQQPDINLGDVTISDPLEPFSQMVSGSTGSVNITMPQATVTYLFTVAATVIVGEDQVEGERSMEIMVYVPDPAIPAVEDIQVSRLTNSSVSLVWDYQDNDDLTVNGFQVVYTANIQWRSRDGYLVFVTESNKQTFQTNAAVLTALTPDTEYEIYVSMLTERGQGPITTKLVSTMPALKERLAYFQFVIGPIESCINLQDDSSAYLQKIQTSVLSVINENLCPACDLGDNNIRDGVVSCHQTKSDQLNIVYRARMIGTESYSATDLVQLLAKWTATGQASFLVDSIQLRVNSQCETNLDRLSAPDCELQEVPTTMNPILITALQKQDSLSGGEIGGLVIGVIIAVLLLLFIILLVMVLVRNHRHDFKDKKLENEDMDDLTESTVPLDNLYEEHSSSKVE